VGWRGALLDRRQDWSDAAATTLGRDRLEASVRQKVSPALSLPAERVSTMIEFRREIHEKTAGEA
jgi:hypothetical protein